MKSTDHTIEYIIGILATSLIAIVILVYALREPQRIEAAQAAQLNWDLDEAMTLYAENCSVCHGLSGEGIGPTPALDNPALRDSDPASMEKVIARGLFNTSMPAWSLEDGGPLGDYQIQQLVLLIQYGDWQAVQDRVVNMGLAPRIPFTTEADPETLEAIKTLPEGDTLARGMEVYADSCVACHGADGVGSSLAPALNDPLLREKTKEELLRIIQNGVPGTLMAGWNAALVSEDQDALLELIVRWDEVPEGAIPAPDKPIAVTEESLALGSELYTANCARCHAAEGQGTPRAPALNVKSFLTDTPDAAIEQIITLGVPDTSMPAWGDRLTDVEIQAIVGFVRSWETTAPEVAVPQRGPWWRTSGGATTGSPALPSGGVSPQGSTHGSAQLGAQATAAASGTGAEAAVQATAAASGTNAEVAVQATTAASGTDAEAAVQATAATGETGAEAGVQATAAGTELSAVPGTGQGLAEGSGQGAAAGQGAGAGNAAAGGHDQTGGGGPPWAQQSQPIAWYEALDWRAYALAAGVLAAALALILAGMVRLRKVV